jgi:hypothetical protein
MAAKIKLYIGPAVPIPATHEVIDALVSASVTSASAEAPGVFQLVFEIDPRSPLVTLFVASGSSSIPIIRVVIAAEIDGHETILIDGVRTQHSISPGDVGKPARLTITGEDLSRVLDYIEFPDIRYPAMPDFARVALVLAKYAFLGVLPKVIPSVLLDVPLPTQKIPQQVGTDLKYIRKLAEDVGYVFMMQPGLVVGQSFGYWGPDLRAGEIQPAINFDMDVARDMSGGSGSVDTQEAKLPIVVIQNPQTGIPIPIPAIANPILNPPLGAIPPIPLKIEVVPGTAKYNPVQAALIGMAKAARSQVGYSKVSGSLDATRYKRLLEPHKLVGLRGFGVTYDGIHYVEKVTSSFSRGELTQQFELTRNGLLSTVERVMA